MTGDSETLRRLAAALPDIPRWLETRGMLLSGAAEIFGLIETSPPSFVVRDTASGLLSVVGAPQISAIREAAARSQGSNEPLICQAGGESQVAEALPGWRRDTAVLHLLADSVDLPRFVVSGPGGMIAQPLLDAEVVPPDRMDDDVVIRFISTAELVKAPRIPDELRRELMLAILKGRLAAVMVNGVPVSFCYAASLTETLWDVSIDTLEPFRRRGYAGWCVTYMIDQMNREGKRPVWGAVESNQASLYLASKLGFRPVDRVVVFWRPGAAPTGE